MSTSHTPNPGITQGGAIFRLHEDILWRIFLMNANMDWDRRLLLRVDHPDYLIRRAKRSLTVTRRSSQVCHLWRRVILDSPSIWARLVDWPMLQQKTDDWLCEVIRRSGQSPLCIKSENPVNEDAKLHILMSLLDANWHRVRKINFGLGSTCDVSSDVVKKLYEVLSRPTKCLQSLILSLDAYDRFAFPEAPILFSNDGASLRELDLHWANLTFDPKVLAFIVNATHLDISTIIEALTHMQLLEHLEIRDCHLIKYEQIGARKAWINLPRLRYVRVVDPLFGAAATIIDAILPNALCVFNYSCRYPIKIDLPGDPLSDEFVDACRDDNLKRLSGTFHSMVDKFMTHQVVEALDVMLDQSCFIFQDIAGLSFQMTHYSSKEHITLGLSVIGPLAVEQLRSLFDSVNSTALPAGIKEIRLDIDPDVVNFADFNFARFFEAMPLLEHIAIKGSLGDVLLFLPFSAEDHGSNAFPRLEKLSLLNGVLHAPNGLEQLLFFLQRRWYNGVPIKVLDILLTKGRRYDFRRLDEMAGLKVTCGFSGDGTRRQDNEYLCGSGNPEKLLFE
ncbi:hypothetical protein CVT26_003238 [Gymnopilus dilepis]|uniref:F-box domain-containing protein n=1 Tax=Gymnopilus dilepis TaxID=231916 RepID=A0A409Y5E9_9AGAR|nr:hypothetical protein CVT26_003238 [Gymnopilus dilepis]